MRPGFWLFVLRQLAGLLPVLLWNASERLGHVQARRTQGVGTSDSGFRWLGPLRFAGEQAAFLIGAWFVVWVVPRGKPSPRCRPGPRVLVVVVGAGVERVRVASFKTTGPNQLARGIVHHRIRVVPRVGPASNSNGIHSKVVSRLVRCGLAIGLALCASLVHYPALMRSALAAVAGPPTEKDQTPIRKYDPTARLRGWKTLATEIDEIAPACGMRPARNL